MCAPCSNPAYASPIVNGCHAEINFAHASTSLTLICKPFIEIDDECLFNHTINLTIAPESSRLLRPHLSSKCSISATINAISAPLLALGIHISVNLDRSAGLNSLLPKSPPGFIVAKNLKLGWATIFSEESPPFSASVISLPDSRALFSLSITASSAKLISSSTNMSPSFIAVTSGPSCHSKSDFDLCHRISAD